ncbi:unnamed protein product [Adineta ricciae]|uniref:Tyrosine-protein kinase ephrin type A/B receptor-like domain-containing protein n=1 Tax=Adineta ricciae TaxID=249248 RepID=A0A815DU54_ADIRI|nr:unnamed protein product [Adineta ricciae]CAF1302120.1 unnamed protein product [Adineta ricciae]
MTFLLISIFLLCFAQYGYSYDHQLTDFDLYGPMLVANKYLVVSVVNRTYPSFAVYRPNSSNEFCIFNISINGLNQTYVMHIAIPSGVTPVPNIFTYQGIVIGNGTNEASFVVQITITSMSPCSYSSKFYKVRNDTPSDYSTLGINSFGRVSVYLDGPSTCMYDFNTNIGRFVHGQPGSVNSSFVYYAMEISDKGWGIAAGSLPYSGYYIPTLFLFTLNGSINPGINNYAVQSIMKVSMEFPWQTKKARPVSNTTDYEPVYGMSLSINENGDVLFGVQSMNTVFHLYVDPTNMTSIVFKGSRAASTTTAGIGFGKSVSWLDDTTAVILANDVSLDYTEWYASRIEIYDLSGGKQLNNTQEAYSSFPTAIQSRYSLLTNRIVAMVASYAGSIIFADSDGSIYIILPSPTGYYSATHIGNVRGHGVYFSSPAICPAGYIKQGPAQGKYLFDTCQICPVGTYYNPNTINSSNTCVACNATNTYCSFGSVADIPLDYTKSISQAIPFPKSPDLTGFEDILLLNMFNTDFETNCLVTTPFFWTLIIMGVGIVFLITMGILTLSGKCKNFRAKIEMIFTHFDIINDGERWIGGVLSITILVMIIFTGLFTSSFLKQYPKETSEAPDFTCDETLRNSQFSSRMQSLGAAIPADTATIFNLLSQQSFVATVTLLNTVVNLTVTVEKTIGTITEQLQRDLYVPTDGCIVISFNLTTNMATITVNITGSTAIGGVRIGLYGPEIVDINNKVQELNFSYAFIIQNQTLSQEPYFEMDLIQVINETKGLSTGAPSQFSGLWIPKFSKDDDRNFQTLAEYEKYHAESQTTLTIDLTQSMYYIYNIEQPIIKTANVVFKNILFVSMCMELFGFGFLFFKLAISPLCRLVSRLICQKNDESKEENNEGESESEKEEEEEDSDDESDGNEEDVHEIPKQIELPPEKTKWYKPNPKY